MRLYGRPSQSLWSRRGLSTTTNNLDRYVVKVSIPLEQGRVFRPPRSQSNRRGNDVSIPLEQGRVFRQTCVVDNTIFKAVSIPLEQGRVFRHVSLTMHKLLMRFNPFGTGQGLSTAGVVWCLGG